MSFLFYYNVSNTKVNVKQLRYKKETGNFVLKFEWSEWLFHDGIYTVIFRSLKGSSSLLILYIILTQGETLLDWLLLG